MKRRKRFHEWRWCLKYGMVLAIGFGSKGKGAC
jgi:hypothetical protein